MGLPDMKKFLCTLALAALLPGCATMTTPPIKVKFEFVDPSVMFRSALTEAGLDRMACTYESLDRYANTRLHARLIESLVLTPPSQASAFEPRNKLVFYFDGGKTEKLVFSGPYSNRNAIDADWQGQGAQVANTLPAELAQYVMNAHLTQLNPEANDCAFLGRY
jgi:hypothetical protein